MEAHLRNCASELEAALIVGHYVDEMSSECKCNHQRGRSVIRMFTRTSSTSGKESDDTPHWKMEEAVSPDSNTIALHPRSSYPDGIVYLR